MGVGFGSDKGDGSFGCAVWGDEIRIIVVVNTCGQIVLGDQMMRTITVSCGMFSCAIECKQYFYIRCLLNNCFIYTITAFSLL